MRRFTPMVLQILVETLGAVLLAVVFAAVWTAVTDAEFAGALSWLLFIAAALWLFGGGSMFPRLIRLEHMQWGLNVSSNELAEDVHGHPPVVLSPLASSVVVALILVGLGLALV
jgi:hypothetical protein